VGRVKTRTCLLVVLWVAVACMVSACKGKVNTPEDGRLKKNVYTNAFFGLQVKVPDSWTILKKPSGSEIRRGTRAMMGWDKEMAAAAAEAAKNVHYLLLARNIVRGTSLGVTAERLAEAPEVPTAEEYLADIRELLTGTGAPLEQVGEITPLKLGSHEFYRLDVAGNMMGKRQHQTMFVAIEKQHALVIFVGAKSQEAVDEVLYNVGLTGPPPQITAAPKGVATVKARETTKTPVKVPSPDPVWAKDIKLQGVSGSETRRFAIINGKTFAAGDGAVVKAGSKYITVRCVVVTETSAKVTVEGVDGERELRLGGY
jgi:hypothetical protein